MNKRPKDYEKITGFVGGEELEILTEEDEKNGAGTPTVLTVTTSWVLPTGVCSSKCD